MEDTVIIREGLLSIQVCSIHPPEQIEKALADLNRISPSGTEHGWVISDCETHSPVACADYNGRWHYVFVC